MPPAKDELTLAQQLLVAAATITPNGGTFTEGQLAVEAWENNNSAFGLMSYKTTHPDNNKVRTLIMGERGLAKRGWFIKAGKPHTYKMSSQGYAEVKRILNDEHGEETAPKTLRKALLKVEANTRSQTVLTRLLVSAAYRYNLTGTIGMIGYLDALTFWGITWDLTKNGKMPPETLKHGMDETLAAILDGINNATEGVVRMRNGGEIKVADLERLRHIHAWLCQTHLARINRLCVQS